MNDIFIDIILHPCPWCKKTPDLYLPLNNAGTGGTWQWNVICKNFECKIRPKSPPVNIRKKQKENISKIAEKLNMLAYIWNLNNPIPAYEKKRISIEELKRKYVEEIDQDHIYEEKYGPHHDKICLKCRMTLPEVPRE